MGTQPAFIHETAVIDEGALIAPGCRIWHFSHVMAGARLGAGCSLGQNVFVAGRASLGPGCKIQNNVSIYDGVSLGDGVFVGPAAVFTNVKYPRSAVSRRDSYENTVVEDHATIGAGAVLVAPLHIGRFALVAAGAVVSRDVPAFALVAGNPARQIGWACQCGRSLAEEGGRWHCVECGRFYRLSDGRLTEAAP